MNKQKIQSENNKFTVLDAFRFFFFMVIAILVGNSILEAAASVIVCVAVMAFKLGNAKKAQKSKLEESEN